MKATLASAMVLLIFSGCNNSLKLVSSQSADVVVGQQDFASKTPGLSAKTIAQSSVGNPTINGNILYVPDGGNNRILGFQPIPTANGESADFVLGQGSFTANAAGTTAGTFTGPNALTMALGKLFISDQGNNRILIYNNPPTGSVPADFVFGQTNFLSNSSACDSSHLNKPAGTFAANKVLVVADSLNNRVLIWNDWANEGSGAPADMVLGQPDFNTCIAAGTENTTQGASYFANAREVWTDGTRLFVADSFNNRVLGWSKFPTADANGVGSAPDIILGSATGSFGTSQSLFHFPTRINSNGTQLFVVDEGNNRVLIWNTIPTTSGALPDVVLGQPDFTSGTCNGGQANPSATTLCAPTGVYGDSERVIVNDEGNTRFLIFNTK